MIGRYLLSRKYHVIGLTVALFGSIVTICLWDRSADPSIVFPHNEGYTRHLCFSHDSQYLAGAFQSGAILIWDVRLQVAKWKLRGNADAGLSFSPDDRFIISVASDCTLCCWETSTGKASWTIDTSPFQPHSIAWTPDGTSLVLGSSLGQQSLLCINPASGEKKRWLDLSASDGAPPGIIRISPAFEGGEIICASSESNSLRVWDVHSGTVTKRLTARSSNAQQGFYHLVSTPKSKLFATSGIHAELLLWDFTLNQDVAVLQESRGACTGIFFSTDGRYLVITSGGKRTQRAVLQLLQVDEKIEFSYETELRGGLDVVAFSPDGGWIAYSASNDTRVVVRPMSFVLTAMSCVKK